jgi:methionyl-tRNA synthetase
LREVSFGQDGSYSEEAIGFRINADLADNFGNMAQRCFSMIFKNCDGIIPEPGPLTADDQLLLDEIDALLPTCRDEMNRQQIHKAVSQIFAASSSVNGYFAVQAPWSLAKSGDFARMATILYVAAEAVRQITILLQPYIPASSAKLLDALAIPADMRDFAALGQAGRLKSGVKIDKPEAAFPKYYAPKE